MQTRLAMCKQDPHDRAVTAVQFEVIGTPGTFERRATQRRRACGRSQGRLALERETVHLQDPEHALAVDRRFAFVRSSRQECRDPAIAIGRPLIDQPADEGQERGILRLTVRAASRRPGWALNQVGARDAERVGIAFKGNRPPDAPRGERQDRFFCPREIERLFEDSASMVLRPSRRSRSLTRFSSSRTLLVPTTSSSAWTAWCPPSRSPFPGKKLARRDAGSPGHQRNRHARLHGLLDQADLLGRRPAPSALHGRDDFNTRRRSKRVRRHSRIIGVSLCLIELCHLSG